MLRFSVIILLLISFSLPAMAAAEILTWEDCVLEALEQHPDLIASAQALNQAKASRAIVKSGALPQITGTLSAKTSQAAAGATTDAYAYDISARQLVFDGFKTAYQLSSSSEDVNSAVYNYDFASSNVRLDLRSAFVELLKAQELLDITEDIAQRRKQNLELVDLRYQAGREHKGSLLNEQANFARAEFEVIQAKRNIELAQRQLIKELGREKISPIKVKGELIIDYIAQAKPDFELLAKSNPVLLESTAQKQAALFDLKSAQADFLPEVYASASAGKSDAHWPVRSESWSAGVSLSLPIFEGGSRIAQLSKTQAALNQAKAEERSTRDAVALALEESWKNWQDEMDKVKVEEKFLSAAQERAKIAQSQYSIGLISFDDWSIIEDNLASAKKSFLNTKVNALLAEAQWIQAKGGNLDYVRK